MAGLCTLQFLMQWRGCSVRLGADYNQRQNIPLVCVAVLFVSPGYGAHGAWSRRKLETRCCRCPVTGNEGSSWEMVRASYDTTGGLTRHTQSRVFQVFVFGFNNNNHRHKSSKSKGLECLIQQFLHSYHMYFPRKNVRLVLGQGTWHTHVRTGLPRTTCESEKTTTYIPKNRCILVSWDCSQLRVHASLSSAWIRFAPHTRARNPSTRRYVCVCVGGYYSRDSRFFSPPQQLRV